MHLPNEILERILQDLPKADLKAARLVNSQCSSCATQSLFDTLYISPHKINIDVFQGVTQHPVLRHCVKQLRYDGVGFSADWIYPQYFARLWGDTLWWARNLREPFDSPDIQVDSFVESARWNHTEEIEIEERVRRLGMAMEKCGDFDSIKAGYLRSQEHAVYERKCIENNNFVRILAVGLQRLDRLGTLSLNDDWPCFEDPVSNVQVPVYFSGSPLARSWGFFDARPLDWSFGTAGWCLPENSAFSNITNALSKTVKRVCNLKHEDGVSPVVFNNQSLDTEPVLRPGMDAFARLKEVKLTISYGYSDANEYKNLRGLRHLLRCVRGLEMLGLGFSRHGSGCGDEWFTYESVFPKDGTWPHLRKFVVQNLKITDEELVHLLFARMFSLQHLEIGDMHLLHGTWERVIETLRFRGLISFEMSSYQLLYDDKECFLAPLIYQEVDDEGRACRDFIASIERYVVYGRHDFTLRHPSLKADQPTQDSLEFLELDDVFGRFQVVRGTADNVLIDTALLKTKIAEVCAEANRNREAEHCETPESIVERATMDK